jgi:hypothetical protein
MISYPVSAGHALSIDITCVADERDNFQLP